MSKDPTIAIHDCLTEIAILDEIAARTTLDAFRSDPIARRAAAYYRLDDAILWEIMTVDASALKMALQGMLAQHADKKNG